MRKLTIAELAPYLPYKLNVLLDGKVKELVGLESPYKTNSNFFIHGIVREVNGTYRQTHSMCLTDKTAHVFKPLLIPLSELTDEDWVEVFKAGDDARRDSHMLSCEIMQHGTPFIKWGHINVMQYDIKNKSFHTQYKFNQLFAFRKLYELHADVEGLIPAGLAIDRKTIEF